MATKKTAPGDAANAFVRVILTDAGAKLGGLTDAEWARTLDRFDGQCAYTGALVDGRMERDHAIPMNREYCGLHLYGNVLPSTKEANRRKAGKHYRDFVEDCARLGRIEAFIKESRYQERVAVFGNLGRYCEAQYRMINALCEVNRQYVASLLPEDADGSGNPSPQRSGRKETLPIDLDPQPDAAFKAALLQKREARIVEIHQDGHTEEHRWDASNMTDRSARCAPRWAVTCSTPAARAAAWNRSPTIFGESGTRAGPGGLHHHLNSACPPVTVLRRPSGPGCQTPAKPGSCIVDGNAGFCGRVR